MDEMSEISAFIPYFEEMEGYFTATQLVEFLHTDEKDLCWYHFGLGTWVRNRLLSEDGALYKRLEKEGYRNKDGMSVFLITAFHRYCHREKEQQILEQISAK